MSGPVVVYERKLAAAIESLIEDQDRIDYITSHPGSVRPEELQYLHEAQKLMNKTKANLAIVLALMIKRDVEKSDA